MLCVFCPIMKKNLGMISMVIKYQCYSVTIVLQIDNTEQHTHWQKKKNKQHIFGLFLFLNNNEVFKKNKKK